jgi:putative DNA primase/helicase
MSDATGADIIDLALRAKPELIVHRGSLPDTAEALRDLLAVSGRLFDRGVPVRVVRPSDGGPPSAIPLTRHNVVMEAHRLCQPVKEDSRGNLIPVTLPDRLAQMYLDMVGDWRLSPLAGISTAPLLSADGSVRTADGYDPGTGLWCRSVPTLTLLSEPSRTDAEEGLRRLRQSFRTFPFADASRCWDSSLGVEVVNLSVPPGRDESAFLLDLLTAICRPSLLLAPGALYTAPAVSGAGSGKGLLVRATCMIAFGISPRAFTTGGERHELEKRLAAELMEAHPAVFLDNANGLALRSDTLASVLTERPARVRVLGRSLMVPLNSTAFIAVTGNGLTVIEDLARRFILCELDARCEDPESRPFAGGFLKDIERQRAELLAAALTIWRWGRQQATALTRGKPLGSYEMWAEWCRDPLLTLGCRDPVERIEALKANDPRRQRIGELFRTWWGHHGAATMKANDLAEPVKAIADPQGRGRQYLATFLSGLAGTHAAGFVLTRQDPAGKWTAATYVLTQAAPTDTTGHRTHRTDGPNGAAAPSPVGLMDPMPTPTDSTGHRTHRTDGPNGAAAPSPVGPMGPMPDATGNDVPPGEEAAI